jgi:tRNA threonylcarbamoyladenosine biosynthesis protein TsaE
MYLRSKSAEDTEAFGALLARARPAEDALTVIYLEGDLGAGKTTFARGFLHGCGITGQVRSPTYTLVEVYEISGLFVIHADLYRLRDPLELEALGLREWARNGYVWLVEWPARGQGHLPPADLSVAFNAGPACHEIQVNAGSGIGAEWLSGLAAVENRLGGT